MVSAAMHRGNIYWRFINEKLTADSYKWMLSHWLLPRLKADHPQLLLPATATTPERLDLIFQQDGASAHRAYFTMSWICERTLG